MYLPLLIDKQLNLTFKTQSLDTNEGTQEYHDYQDKFEYQDHIFENEILLSISRHGIKLNLLDYFYSIFFGKNPSFGFEHRLNALETLTLKILISVEKSALV
ncbi:unnamed protein product [Adineta steineri]|uniref:Uncharacterized protein n=1 Tax=Adineta steineri TaxID=433720 RepID=A0A818KYM2_9BILA|nr:unnamed protein product [Adineta steineri]CAF3569661.1 unnamed protein product [Adineta steineri]